MLAFGGVAFNAKRWRKSAPGECRLRLDDERASAAKSWTPKRGANAAPIHIRFVHFAGILPKSSRLHDVSMQQKESA
jgi:hypothetical protein